MKPRATPQLSLPLGESAVDPRRATAFRDDSPFDPEAEWTQTASTGPIPVPPLPPRPKTPPVRVGREHVHRLATELKLLVGNTVRLQVHDNRSTMVSFRRVEERLHLRVHHMFLNAGPDVVRALADYARARSPRAGRVLDQYVRQHRSHIRPADIEQARARPLQTRGSIHDLRAIYDTLNRRYFAGGIDARIGWGRGTTSRRRRSIRMGAYYHETQTILIHPALDRPEVPDYFVALVVYHEMLHQAVPQKRTDEGRRSVHSPEFRQRERQFHDFERARAWERRHLSLLLRPARR